MNRLTLFSRSWLTTLAALSLAACSANVDGIAPEGSVASADLRGQYVVFDANSQNGGQPHRIGGCNVWYAYEAPHAVPVSGEVAPNFGYAFLTGDVNDCARACGNWQSSYAPGYEGTRYVHRQLTVYNFPVFSAGNFTYPTDMTCMVVDHEQWCLPAYGVDEEGEIDLEDAFGEVYCENW